MSPIQQMLLGAGAVATKTYVDDVYSTTLYKSTGSAVTISTGINNATDGGMLWVKSRTDAVNHGIWDTERTNGEYLPVNSDDNGGPIAAATGSSPFLRDGGFRWNTDHNWFNKNNSEYATFNFKKAKGFFDVVTYDGDNGAPGFGTKDIAHGLGCIPGLIIVKQFDVASRDWWVYHRDLPVTTNAAWNQVLQLNETDGKQTAYNLGSASTHTATTFRVGNDNQLNQTGHTYVAYLFAGGESTAATARSVDFDGSGNEALTIPNSSDLNISTGDWTIECWAKPDDTDDGGGVLLSTGGGTSGNYEATMFWLSDLNIEWYIANSSSSWIHTAQVATLKKGQWSHIAATREGNTFRFFLDGTLTKEFTDSATLNNVNSPFHIGGRNSGSAYNGLVSNFRLVKGTAVYTSSFRPPTEPLTNITNTKLLCCNDSSVTGSTVTPGTITSQGNAAASTDSPFDDPAGFVFGDAGDQNVVKCSSYVGNGSATGPEINLGWEPQWVMVKNITAVGLWLMADNMRGVVNGGDDPYLQANGTNAEYTTYNWIEFTSTGFKLTNTGVSLNANGDKYVYICIRRSDGYVGKPPELGTGAFATDTAAATTPNFDSGFPVDFTFIRTPASNSSWYTGARLISGKLLHTNTSSAQGSHSEMAYYDFNEAYGGGGWWDANVNQAWMWKRHAGFDVVCYSGNQTNRDIRHSMGIAPTMVWLKSRTSTEAWVVGSSGLSSWDKYLTLNNNDGESTNAGIFNSKAPTATHFSLGTQNRSNENDQDYIAFLFASVSGISSVGSYTGNGQTGNSGTFVTTGFQPRLVWVKRFDGHGQDWPIYDSLRGFNADTLYLNELDAATAVSTAVEVSSTGFRLITNNANTNGNTDEYIYYAHA